MGEALRGVEAAPVDAPVAEARIADAPKLGAPKFQLKFQLRSAALVAEIIGGLAVVVSLIFVGVQLAQANKLERNAAMQRHIEAVTDLQRSVSDTPVTLDAFRKAARGEELSLNERINLESFLIYSDRTWEGLYLQYLDGQIDRDLWEAHRAQARPLHNSPVARAVWGARKMWFTPRYRAFRDAELAANTGERLTYDYFDALETPQPTAPQAAPAPEDSTLGGRHD